MRHFPVLLEAAMRKFAMGVEEAEELAHDVLLASLLQQQRVVNMDAHLAAALDAAAQKQRGSRHGR
ncbi:MAG TPA: hypothetical protein VF618_03430 [Thermoanaerobaculia bacterium]